MNPDESAKKQFELISLAYETLSDDQKKQLYDNQNGFGARSGNSSFRDYHSHKKRRANSTIFSDDEQDSEEEYYDLYRRRGSDKRTMPGRGGKQNF